MYCWGDNEFQQLGLNKDKNKYFSIPTAVTTPSGHQIQQVACGSNFTAVLTKSKQTFLITLPLDLWVGIQWGPILWIWAKDSQKIKKNTNIPRITDEGWNSKKHLTGPVEKKKTLVSSSLGLVPYR